MTAKNILISILAFLAAWKLVVVATGFPPFILPGPERVFGAMYDNSNLILEHSAVTLSEVLIGIVLGSAVGIFTAIQLAMSEQLRNILRPILVFSQSVPVFALAPVLTLWLGYGLSSKIAMTVLVIYFPVTSAFFDGLSRTPRGYLDLAQTMGATRMSILFRIRIPAALPSLATGLRLAAVYAPIGAVIGEWVGASRGLGYLMLLANGRAKTDLMFASLIVLGVLSVTLYLLIDLMGRKLLASRYAS